MECPRCGVRVEEFPWAEPWARVTTALSNAVAVLARELNWQGTAREYGLNWKSVATIVKRAVQYGLKHRARPPVHVIGIDEVSRRKGQVYLTVVYDLERRVLLWVGDDRTEEAVRPFFTEEMGKRRCHTLRVVCMDMWAAYANLVREHAPNAQLLFDRFHIVRHLNEAVDAVRRQLWRQLASKERVTVKGTRWLLLKNPWNLNPTTRRSGFRHWSVGILRWSVPPPERDGGVPPSHAIQRERLAATLPHQGTREDNPPPADSLRVARPLTRQGTRRLDSGVWRARQAAPRLYSQPQRTKPDRSTRLCSGTATAYPTLRQ